mmetsp:Transcript_2617/g.2982  ORF Transcript_2617/g.2982 Transcript_2617/m.2982 type:complete len:89 (-) Transcript_2617:824-1090(-)
MAVLDSFCYGIISERLAESKEKVASRGDILSLFVQADNQLPKQYLRNILMSFFIAGRGQYFVENVFSCSNNEHRYYRLHVVVCISYAG